MRSRVGQQGILGLSLPEDAEDAAVRFASSRGERATLTRQIIAAIEPFDVPYASKASRYIVTDDEEYGEFFELSRPTRNSRCFPGRALKRNVETFNQFMAFAKGQDTTNWRFWCVKLPGRKAPVDGLIAEVNRFNREINIRFSDLRKKRIFEPLLVGMHVRYDHNEDAFDLHLHVICRIVPERHDEIFKQLGNKFSKADVKVDEPIRNLEASVTYLLWGIIPHKELVTWPRRVFEPVWKLSLTKAQLMRPCGSFRVWRGEQSERAALSKPTKEQVQELRAANAEARSKVERNRAETAYPAPQRREDRCLARIKFTSPADGRRRSGRLYEREIPPARADMPVGEPTAEPQAGSGIAPAKPIKPSATVTTTQGRTERVRPSQGWWRQAWPYGGHSAAGRLPRPIRRRLARCQGRVRHVADPIPEARSRRLHTLLHPEGLSALATKSGGGVPEAWANPWGSVGEFTDQRTSGAPRAPTERPAAPLLMPDLSPVSGAVGVMATDARL